jgi:hypothetical protein
MIENTLKGARNRDGIDEQGGIPGFLDFLCGRFWKKQDRTRVFGVTVGNGAYEKHTRPDGVTEGPTRIESRFMAGEVVDLVGAGDSFRAGLLTYIARNLDQFRDGSMDFAEAVQMGNLFASLYIKSPLIDRYRSRGYEKMLKVVRRRRDFRSFEAMQKALS